MRYASFLLLPFLALVSCDQNNLQQKETAITKNRSSVTTMVKHEQKINLPFIGKRDFETRPGVSGTGTPHRSVEILKNGDVYFSFIQENQAASDEVIEEKYYAGKFQKFMKCVFKKWDNEISYYEITKDKMYEVDSNHKRLNSSDCCGLTDEISERCSCEGDLYE